MSKLSQFRGKYMNHWVSKLIIGALVTGGIAAGGMLLESFISTVYANRDDNLLIKPALAEIRSDLKEIKLEQKEMRSEVSEIRGRLRR